MALDYNAIAKKYDALVLQDVSQKTFPYSGYQVIQDLMTDDLSSQKKKVHILDLGCGTGKLYEHLNPNSFVLTGIDSSEQMLSIAKSRYPKSTFIHHDLLKGLPSSIQSQTYDYIVINYVFMHFTFKTTLDMIHILLKHLKKMGRIMIADLLFINPICKQEFFYTHQGYNDLDVYFHVYSQYVNKISNQLALSFFEINEYTGMMIIENINDFTLLFEDPLVKYKSNTAKWRSTHPQRKSE